MDDTQGKGMSEEQAQNLRALEAAAGEPDAAVAQLEQKEADQAQAVMDQGTTENVQAVMLMLQLAVPLLSKLYPSIGDVYTEDACVSVASSVGPVLTKYGVSLGDMGGKYKEEITMVVVCWPIAAATYEGIKSDIAAREKQVPKAVASKREFRHPEAVAPTHEPVVLG
jgi:hypothetical protein